MEGLSHVPVMLSEVLEALPLKPGAVVVDGTLGLAGHALAMAERVAPGGAIVGLDWDKAMLAEAERRLADGPQVEHRLFHTDYRELPEKLAEACKDWGRPNGADAILLDLGLNNAQITDPGRGFSFQNDGPLDMRMDRSKGEPVSALVNRLGIAELESIIRRYGDENWARRIAQVIVDRRKQTPIHTTFELVDCVMAAIPAAMRDKRIHPATRTFQALRIYVNDELEGLEQAIEGAAKSLLPGGVLVVLAYHSGEDRAAKHVFKSMCRIGGYEEVTKKPLSPTEEEVRRNPKSRSAKLRAIRKEANP